MFGSSHLYVFHHPKDEATQLKKGKPIQEPTYSSAQEEIAKKTGLFKEGKDKSKGQSTGGTFISFKIVLWDFNWL